jgi:hypothetical protein
MTCLNVSSNVPLHVRGRNPKLTCIPTRWLYYQRPLLYTRYLHLPAFTRAPAHIYGIAGAALPGLCVRVMAPKKGEYALEYRALYTILSP